jgi:hypothetical protein
MRDHSFFAADAYDERLTLHARDGVHARYLQEIGDVFGVVYLVKERLLIGVHIHGGDEYIFGFERHLILHLHGSAFRSLAGWVRECTQPRFHRDIEGIRGERLIGVSGVSQGKLVASEVHRVAGEIALKSPKPDAAKAEAYFERALAVARQQQAKSWDGPHHLQELLVARSGEELPQLLQVIRDFRRACPRLLRHGCYRIFMGPSPSTEQMRARSLSCGPSLSTWYHYIAVQVLARALAARPNNRKSEAHRETRCQVDPRPTITSTSDRHPKHWFCNCERPQIQFHGK